MSLIISLGPGPAWAGLARPGLGPGRPGRTGPLRKGTPWIDKAYFDENFTGAPGFVPIDLRKEAAALAAEAAVEVPEDKNPLIHVIGNFHWDFKRGGGG